ncbi:MAG: D-alanyl-D-alanine carboxypeptidase [Methylococcales bacterium]|nr:D-alanyl-D-alanine carboxypeptidase [Methylococcales bacterium]
MKNNYLSLFFILLTLFSSQVLAQSSLQRLYQLPKASLAVAGRSNLNFRPNKLRVPASTLKVLTALLALKKWGSDHHFKTDFYFDKKTGVLTVKGYGDPYLTSEELDKMIQGLKDKGLAEIKGLNVDDSYFEDNIFIDGRSRTNNPYDAPLSALAINFNTLNIRRTKSGISSGESQTPLTPLMRRFAKRLPRGKHRVNLQKQSYAATYFAEVFQVKLEQHGIKVSGEITSRQSFKQQTPFYQHSNSKTLSETVAAMLKYSNNFIANQLFLMLGAEAEGQPATIQKSRQAYSEQVKALFNWDRTFYEGAGLSRKNFISANEMLQVLEQFAPYRELMKSQNDRIFAKTGTLTGVSTYAGYLYKNNGWTPFALFINQAVSGNFRMRVASELLAK